METTKKFRPYEGWNEVPMTELISIYKRKPSIRFSILNSLSYFSFYPGVQTTFNQFFLMLHDSSCKHQGSQICLASPSQQEAFKLMVLDRMLILVNDSYLNTYSGWPLLIESLRDAEIQAKVIIAMRTEFLRTEVIDEITSSTRDTILTRINKLQVHNAEEGDQWCCIATDKFSPICSVCNKGYKLGGDIIKKACGKHTTHSECAKKKWGRRRIYWRGTPCQLCQERGYVMLNHTNSPFGQTNINLGEYKLLRSPVNDINIEISAEGKGEAKKFSQSKNASRTYTVTFRLTSRDASKASIQLITFMPPILEELKGAWAQIQTIKYSQAPEYDYGETLGLFALIIRQEVPDFARSQIEIHIENVDDYHLARVKEGEFIKRIRSIELLLPRFTDRDLYSIREDLYSIREVMDKTKSLRKLVIKTEREIWEYEQHNILKNTKKRLERIYGAGNVEFRAEWAESGKAYLLDID